MTRRTPVATVALTALLAGCGSGTLSNTDLAKQVSRRYGPDQQHGALVACYTPRDAGTFNRVCYDPLTGTRPADSLYVRVTGHAWCVVWPKGKDAPRCH